MYNSADRLYALTNVKPDENRQKHENVYPF